jgi:hypothetical protein
MVSQILMLAAGLLLGSAHAITTEFVLPSRLKLDMLTKCRGMLAAPRRSAANVNPSGVSFIHLQYIHYLTMATGMGSFLVHELQLDDTQVKDYMAALEHCQR